MGPVIILDKSALQLLSKDEVSFLYKHYYVVIPPILIVEILADLSKKDKSDRMPEDFVRHLADKLSPMDSCINVHYREACLASLAGHDVPMDGRALIPGGVPLVTSTGERGIFIEEPPERKAIMNWRFGHFSEAERVLAQRWRESTRTLVPDIRQDAYERISILARGQRISLYLWRRYPMFPNRATKFPVLPKADGLQRKSGRTAIFKVLRAQSAEQLFLLYASLPVSKVLLGQ